MMQKLVQNGARPGRRGRGAGSDVDGKNSKGATESDLSRGGKMAYDVCRTGFGDDMRRRRGGNLSRGVALRKPWRP